MKGKSRRNQNMVVAFIIAALIVLFVILFAANRDEPKYEPTIKELGGTSMLATSNSQELGTGEIKLNYSKDMVVQDVNGQIIDYAELSVEDRINVELADAEEGADSVIDVITLIPEGSDEYI